MSKLALGAALSLVVMALPRHASADEWWGRDKALHGTVSLLLGAAGYAASSPWLERRTQRAGAGFVISFSLGLAKEGYDCLGEGDPSSKDLVWDAAGALTGASLAMVLDQASRALPP